MVFDNPPHLEYVAMLPCNLLLIACFLALGNVAIYARCGEMLNNCFTANFLENLSVKEFWKSVKIWLNYGHEFGVQFFAHPVFLNQSLWINATPLYGSNFKTFSSLTVKVCSHFTTHKPNWTELQFWTLHSGSSEQGQQGQRLLSQLLGRGSSAPPEVCRCDRLTVMIINRWKSPAFVCLCFVRN